MNTYHLDITVETTADLETVRENLARDISDARENYPAATITVEQVTSSNLINDLNPDLIRTARDLIEPGFPDTSSEYVRGIVELILDNSPNRQNIDSDNYKVALTGHLFNPEGADAVDAQADVPALAGDLPNTVSLAPVRGYAARWGWLTVRDAAGSAATSLTPEDMRALAHALLARADGVES